jgi:hypothetical protein
MDAKFESAPNAGKDGRLWGTGVSDGAFGWEEGWLVELPGDRTPKLAPTDGRGAVDAEGTEADRVADRVAGFSTRGERLNEADDETGPEGTDAVVGSPAPDPKERLVG